MHKKFQSFLDAFFSDYESDPIRFEAALSSMPLDLQSEWNRFKTSEFYPDEIALFLSVRSIEIKRQKEIEKRYSLPPAASELTD